MLGLLLRSVLEAQLNILMVYNNTGIWRSYLCWGLRSALVTLETSSWVVKEWRIVLKFLLAPFIVKVFQKVFSFLLLLRTLAHIFVQRWEKTGLLSFGWFLDMRFIKYNRLNRWILLLNSFIIRIIEMAYKCCWAIFILIKLLFIFVKSVQLRYHLKFLILNANKPTIGRSIKVSQHHIFSCPISVDGSEWRLDTTSSRPVRVHWVRFVRLLYIVEQVESNWGMVRTVVNFQVHFVQFFLWFFFLVHESEVVRIVHPLFFRVSLYFFSISWLFFLLVFYHDFYLFLDWGLFNLFFLLLCLDIEIDFLQNFLKLVLFFHSLFDSHIVQRNHLIFTIFTPTPWIWALWLGAWWPFPNFSDRHFFTNFSSSLSLKNHGVFLGFFWLFRTFCFVIGCQDIPRVSFIFGVRTSADSLGALATWLATLSLLRWRFTLHMWVWLCSMYVTTQIISHCHEIPLRHLVRFLTLWWEESINSFQTFFLTFCWFHHLFPAFDIRWAWISTSIRLVHIEWLSFLEITILINLPVLGYVEY